MQIKPVGGLAQAETPETATVSEVKPEAVETPPAEAVAPEAVQATAVETPPAVEAKPPEVKVEGPAAPEVKALSREEFARIADKFGDAIAAKVMRDGGDYRTALELAFDAAKKETETLRSKVAEYSQRPANGTPVTMTSAKKSVKLFHTGK